MEKIKGKRNISKEELVRYFLEKYGGCGIERTELSKKENWLYARIKRAKLLDKLIPKKKKRKNKTRRKNGK